MGFKPQAKTSLLLGVETVSITYCLFMLESKISKLPSAFQRKTPIENLKADIGKKGVELGDSILAYMNDLMMAPAAAAEEEPQGAHASASSRRSRKA